MSSMGETSLSFVSSILPSDTANTIIGTLILTMVMALGIHHISPTRLIRVLVTLLHETDTMYIHAVEAGLVPSDVDANATDEVLRAPRREPQKFAINFENDLRIFPGPLARIIQCIRDVQDLKTRIEISKEQLSILQALERRQHGPCMPEGATFTLPATRATADVVNFL
ncbi:hypothetical protein C8J57DRAFT_1262026 [Mycena rebaudengoi]|nr:hypothetical protein C8J57DRAFT_1262026 [Mycena rebaudengoi]